MIELMLSGSDLDVVSYEVVLDLTHDTNRFLSRSRVCFRCGPDSDAVFADLHAVDIRQMTLNGTHLDANKIHDGRLELPGPTGENTLVVEAEMGYTTAAQGLHRIADAAGGSACAYSKTFPAGASRIFCCFDKPHLCAPFNVSVRTPAGWSCLSNASVVARPAGGDAGIWRFAPTAPLAPHVFSLCAGPYSESAFACQRDRGGPLPVTFWTLPTTAPLLDPEAALELIQQPLRYYERNLGVPYHYAKCDLVFVPEFPVLASSAPGIITLRDQALKTGQEVGTNHYLAMVFAHELAHAWFGGLVGIRRLDDAWLIEAITTYISRIALEETLPGIAAWTAASTSPPPPDRGYADDAAAVSQLETLIGRQAVMRGLGSLLRHHAHGSVTKDDLVRSWSQASGRDLRTWAAETLIPARRREDRGAE